MPVLAFTIQDVFSIKRRGTVVVPVERPPLVPVHVGDLVEIREDGRQVLSTTISGVEAFMVDPPPPPGIPIPIGVMLSTEARAEIRAGQQVWLKSSN